jgi:hypothetical protein
MAASVSGERMILGSIPSQCKQNRAFQERAQQSFPDSLSIDPKTRLTPVKIVIIIGKACGATVIRNNYRKNNSIIMVKK